MKLSLLMTVNNRTEEVCEKVAESLKLPGNQPDELIIVLDRPTTKVRQGVMCAYHNMGFRTVYTTINGKEGWLGPAKAWNTAFNHATGDLLYCISSEVVQDAGNVDKARKLAEDGNTAVFGACHNSVATQLVTGAEPGLLVSSKMPRPLGFIVCMPAKKVTEIGGFDEEFMKGFWYDDDDFFLRLWQSGVNFTFSDDIHGVHIDHQRPTLDTMEGQVGISTNRRTMIRKHGSDHPWPALEKVVYGSKGETRWLHV